MTCATFPPSRTFTLTFKYFDISLFIQGVERYFGHFSPTLRSVSVFNPVYTPRQLSHLLSLFPNLDNIKIYGSAPLSNKPFPDTELIPFSTPTPRGRLVVCDFDSVET